jgi:hypothetical protein
MCGKCLTKDFVVNDVRKARSDMDIRLDQLRYQQVALIDDTMQDISKALDSLFFTYQELAQTKAKLDKSLSNEIKSI